MRNLLIIILVFIGIWWARGALRRFKAQGGIRQKGAGKPVPAERMLECRHCGLIVPESEGVRAGEDFYCCDAHRRAGRAD
ncbi:MAG: PP0621 family protein [Thauera sp.]